MFNSKIARHSWTTVLPVLNNSMNNRFEVKFRDCRSAKTAHKRPHHDALGPYRAIAV